MILTHSALAVIGGRDHGNFYPNRGRGVQEKADVTSIILIVADNHTLKVGATINMKNKPTDLIFLLGFML